jgi:hypothetical protein
MPLMTRLKWCVRVRVYVTDRNDAQAADRERAQKERQRELDAQRAKDAAVLVRSVWCRVRELTHFHRKNKPRASSRAPKSNENAATRSKPRRTRWRRSDDSARSSARRGRRWETCCDRVV